MRRLRVVPDEPFSGDIPFGHDYPDTQRWCDRDGHIYDTDNPPMLRLRRTLDRVRRAA